MEGSTNQIAKHDYTIGTPRRHHSLYIEDGNLVIQVESAIFNVHRSFLAKHSTTFRDMFILPPSKSAVGGSDEDPLPLPHDSVSGWENILNTIYQSIPYGKSEAYNGKQLLSALSIAHKYGMEAIEEAIIARLKEDTNGSAAYANLIVAARTIASPSLYRAGIEGLRYSADPLSLEDAKRIGIEACHEVMTTLFKRTFLPENFVLR